MSEYEAIINTSSFQSKDTVKKQLTELGIQPGDAIIVHSSLQSMGWISGGGQAVLLALMETVTEQGTIVMPAQSADNSDPQYWMMPMVPAAWHESIRQTIPAYDPYLTHLREMGKVADCLHRHPKTIRSPHPSHSFIAWGECAYEWMKTHPLEDSFGIRSPLGKMIHHDVKILFIGVGYDSCTALHLAEYLAPGLTTFPQGAAIMKNGIREWVTYDMADVNSDIFPQIGESFEKTHGQQVVQGKIGQADSKVIPMRSLIGFGTTWMTDYRENDTSST